MTKRKGGKGYDWLVYTVIGGAALYGAVMGFQNSFELKHLVKTLEKASDEMARVKRLMYRAMFDPKANRIDLGEELISDSRLLNGVKDFNAGNYLAAFDAWKTSGKSGNPDAFLAVSVATEVLSERAKAPNVNPEVYKQLTEALEQGKNAQQALATDPKLLRHGVERYERALEKPLLHQGDLPTSKK